MRVVIPPQFRIQRPTFSSAEEPEQELSRVSAEPSERLQTARKPYPRAVIVGQGYNAPTKNAACSIRGTPEPESSARSLSLPY